MAERRPRVLIVLAHFDEMRQFGGRPNFMPQGVGHAFLAGALNGARFDIRLYSEFHSGPLTDTRLLAWPDMVVLTGVTSALDRMRHLTAYIRTLAPKAIIVAGGPVVRNLPKLTADIFDYTCDGDVEQLGAVVDAVFGPGHAAERPLPRFDLLGWQSRVIYAETSRYCNFRCSFCALTGERRRFRPYPLDEIEAQILSQPAGKYLAFIDNTFFGNNRAAFEAKLDLIGRLWRQGRFKGWIALVTGDFFANAANLERAKAAGCVGLFSGIESLDAAQLARYGKRQNTAIPQIEAAERCLQAGIAFQYGLIFDPSTQRIADMQAQLDFVLGCDRIPLPAFMSMTIPLLGTPYFDECLAEGRFMPHAPLRDFDGVTLVMEPLDPVADVIAFIRRIKRLSWASRAAAGHSLRFFRRYGGALSGAQMVNMIGNSVRLCLPEVNRSNAGWLPRAAPQEIRTHLTSTQPLGALYKPMIRVDARYLGHFEPTLVTDASGALHPALARDLAPAPGPAPRRSAVM
ncbi:MAG: radical SAM protein [Pseudomonadota bacterium]